LWGRYWWPRTTRARPMPSAGRQWLFRLEGCLRRAAVDVDIRLAGQLHNGVHDLVGHPSQDVAVIACVCVGGEVHWLADPDLGSVHGGNLEESRWDQLSVDHADRNQRHPRLQDEPRHACLAFVEAAIRRSGAFRIDAEQLPAAQHTKYAFHAGATGPATGAVHRKLADAFEEPGQDSATDPATLEQLLLGRKGDPPPDHGGQ